MTAKDCAKYIIQQSFSSDKPMTNLRLQKTLYYIQGYFYRNSNKKLFDDEFEHWQYGPVIPDVYFEYSTNGASRIYPSEDNSSIPVENPTLLNRIISACSKLASSDLVEKTHQEDPWKNTSSSETISNESIEKYFKANNPLNL